MARRVAAAEHLTLIKLDPLETRIDNLADMAMRGLGSSAVIVSWSDVAGQWNHVGVGSYVDFVPEGVPPWLDGCTRNDLYVAPDKPGDLPAGFPPGLVAAPLRGVDAMICGTIASFESVATQRTDRPKRLTHYAAWAESELRSEALQHNQQRLLLSLGKTRRMALQDSLTRLWNRHAVFNLLNNELLRAAREQQPTGVIFADLDRFERINERYGEAIGDQVIRGASALLSDAVRPYDILGRFGGEEFLMILPNCPPDMVERVAERMRVAISGRMLDTDAGPISVTTSLGVSCAQPSDAIGPRALLYAADRALVRAKSRGQDCVCRAGDDDYQVPADEDMLRFNAPE